MKTLRILFSLTLFALTACNGSDTTIQKVPYTDPAVTEKIDALTQALAAATHADAKRFAKLQLVGQSHGVASAERVMAIGQAAVVAPSFGPCTDMGVLIGFTNSTGEPANALTASDQVFRQCTGYQYAAQVSSGAIDSAERIFWDGPNCTGNIIDWEASGAGYNTSSLVGGVVFASPIDGSILMVKAGQTPQSILIQSVWVRENPGCQSDVETQLMYQVSENDVTISGVPNGGVGKFQLGSP